MVQNPLLWDANTPLMRKARTGMSDEQLAILGYISVLWNALERNLVAAIWAAANWDQETGELVTADMPNVSRADLLLNLMNKNIVDDAKLMEIANVTVALYNLLRGARNDLMHGFHFNKFYQSVNPPSLMKISAKRRTGAAEIKSIAVDLSVLEELATDLSLCEESFNDLYHRLFFRNLWNAGERGVFAQNYEDAVHGWRAPSFEISYVQESLRIRSQRLNPPQPNPPRPPSRRKARQSKTTQE
ncbi:hypothetical protein [Methylobacterium organophilum]|uniref:hypothetical protein n=1 Tax=Methylobacterium organophilum TaxID=410 RepID=UPI001EE3A0BA|nr:hypothetical protein [Methylobacterium organophilum]